MEEPPKSDAANNAVNISGGTAPETTQRQHQNRNKSTLLYDDRVLDHYSLPTPSSTVRFRSAHVHIYDSQGSQLIMEERVTRKKVAGNSATDYDGAAVRENWDMRDDDMPEQSNTTTVTVKRVGNSSPELLFLRGLYSAIAFFMAAFLFIFAVGLLLFLISDIANQAREIFLYDMSDDEGEYILCASKL
jgi:hypothetical protein